MAAKERGAEPPKRWWLMRGNGRRRRSKSDINDKLIPRFVVEEKYEREGLSSSPSVRRMFGGEELIGWRGRGSTIWHFEG